MANDFRHRNLRRLGQLWVEAPIFFVTCCIEGRQPLLTNPDAFAILHEVWSNSEKLYGWQVGSYVIMPDHVHFFCAASMSYTPLHQFVGKWKEWTAKYLHRRHAYPQSIWQARFFDHLLRSEESYQEKWHYVQQNPVRAGLVSSADDWPWGGVIHSL